jgi:CspA family cold shock protein
MFYGIIKSISDRGFGFIEQDNGPDVYFHATDVGDEIFRQLRLNQPVKFEFVKRKRDENEKPSEKKGPRAAKLLLIDRIPGGTLPPPPPELTARHHPKARQRKATWKRRIDVQSKPGGEGGSQGPAGDQP